MTTFKIKPDLKFITSHPAYFIAFGFGSGLAPWAPGTFGTLAAFPCYWLLRLAGIDGLKLALLCLPLFLLGVYVSEKADQALGVHDHGGANFDEVVAMLLILAVTPSSWLAWGVAFALFRLFDILKPWPIRWFDEHVHGGFGVMLDDVVAAVPCMLLIILLQHFHLL
ncbi:phosphatidylglycerophosphatase A family protein [Paludibacterium purpuratum]|uniref:Phosphatidylglycerophosphatase A n=1 Tax=Paludibacterium purpuratum TaxID=1144873 RepID=A0A4V3DUQ7_9NEIS|nr:phosphatidylglycerophosphatase A [Paludibacterium purpuratum]TDR73880.1 phosphatidylglycerophosphatase [Paludibacterium purpuratum]